MFRVMLYLKLRFHFDQPKSFRNVSFNVRKGEILGVAGLVGAQRTELMEGLFGLRCHSKGHIRYAGKELTIISLRMRLKKELRC